MQRYGARDFVTIQPYLQQLPRDYPIRVLSAALAYRLWRIRRRPPRYEDGEQRRAHPGGRNSGPAVAPEQSSFPACGR